MPHFKCVACRTRLYSAARPAGPAGRLCPGCGSSLEPVGELAEIVGFQSMKRRDNAADDSRPRRHQRIAGRVDDLFGFSSETVAEAIALPIPDATRADLDGRRR